MAGTGRLTCSRTLAPWYILAHPLGVKAFTYRRVKNDQRDAADLLQACGARVHLAHPLGVKMFGYQRARDRRPRRDQPRRAAVHGPAPEAWLAPPEIRELRELVRYRAKLVALRSGLKA